MKKSFFVLSTLAVAALALVSCNKEQEISIEVEPQGVPFEIVASPIQTKTVNDDMSTLWKAGDQINLFHVVSGETTYVNDGAFEATADGASVSFTGTLASALSDGNYNWYAVYPYAAAFDAPDGSATITIPAAQTQTGNDSKAHLAGANCPVAGNVKTVAHDATPTVAFKHLTTIIKVHVTNKTAAAVTVDGVSFTAPININGAFNLDLAGTSPAMLGAGGSKTTALTVSGADALAVDGSADYYLAVKPFSVSAGQEISLTVSTDAGDQTLTTIMPSDYPFVVGKIATLNFNYTNKAVTLARFKYNDADWLDAQSITKPASNAGTNLTGSTQTVDEISLTSTDGSTATRVWNKESAYDLRVYKNGGSFKLSSTDGYLISKIAVTESGVAASPTFGTNAANIDVSCGTKTGTTKNVTWTGLSQDVIFTACTTNTLQIGTITVFYQEKTASDHVVSLPVVAKGVAYNAPSTTFDIRTVNVSDLEFSSTSPGYSSHSYAANVLTVNLDENSGTDPRDVVINVSSASAGFAGTLTITQDGGPTKINTLTSSSTGVTVVGQVTALTTKGFVLTDNTASIYVYLNATPSAYSIGQTVTVAGDVSTNNKGLQFTSAATITAGAAGSYVYPSPAAFGLAEVTAFNADASNRLATYVQFNAVVDHSSSYYNFYVGGTSANNATLYAAPTSFTSGLETGDYVTVKGYAAIVSSGRMGVYVTEITESATAPALVFTDITDVAAAGVAGATKTVSPFRIPVAAPTVTCDGTVVTAASINAECNTITYTVSSHATSSPREGSITVTFTVSETPYAYTIKVTQAASGKTQVFDLKNATYASANDDLATWSSTPINMTLAKGESSYNVTEHLGSGASDHTRMYNKQVLTITPASGKTIVSITFSCTSADYATKLKNASWTNGTAEASSSSVVVTAGTGTSPVSAIIGSATRINTVTVLYTE